MNAGKIIAGLFRVILVIEWGGGGNVSFLETLGWVQYKCTIVRKKYLVCTRNYS